MNDTYLVEPIDIGPALKQQGNRTHLPAINGEMQRCVAVLVGMLCADAPLKLDDSPDSPHP